MKNMICSLLVLSGLVGTALAAEYYVATSGNDNAAGTSWATAVQTIQQGVNKANQDNDVVWVSDGTYTVTTSIYLSRAITVQSLNGAEATIVAGGYPASTNRCFYIENVNIVLDGFTITNGSGTNTYEGCGVLSKRGTIKNCVFDGNHGASAGGGLSCESTLVTNCVFRNNSTWSEGGVGGGGVYLKAGSVMVDCTVVSNQAYRGGGVCLAKNANALVKNCRIAFNSNTATNSANAGGGVLFDGLNAGVLQDSEVSNNTAIFGGGVSCGSGCIVTNCLISENFATTEGGGVVLNNGGTVVGCRIIGNQAGTTGNGGGGVKIGTGGTVKDSLIAQNRGLRFGGGAYMLGGVLENCTIISNSTVNSDGFGGGLNCYLASPSIINCLIAGNTVAFRSGGINFSTTVAPIVQNCTIYGNMATNSVGSESGGMNANAGILVQNTIIYANTALNSPDASVLSGTYSNCCISVTNGINGAGNIAANPLLRDPAAGDYRLTGQSPCVNAGINESWMSAATDLAGMARLDQLSGIVDIGAYEYLPSGTMILVQ